MHPRRLKGLMIKESLQVVRDPSAILIAFVLPLMLLFLFGYGVSLDADRLRVGLALESSGGQARSFAESLAGSRFFSLAIARDRRELAPEMVAGRIRGIVVVPQDFDTRLARGEATAPVQVITDGSEPNTAAFVQNYVQGAWSVWLAQRGRMPAAGASVAVEPRFWFNPELRSRNTIVPALVSIVMTLIGTMLTALVVAREWERGTMEALMATPVTIAEILFGKIVPYFLLGLGAMTVCTVVARLLFDVPLQGSVLALLAVSSAFLAPALALGILISALTRNQFVAAQAALMAAFLPSTLLSGFIYEIGSMPWPIRMITNVIHARWFVESLQTLFLAGDVWPLLLPRVAAMLAIGAFFFAIAGRFTKKRVA